MIPSGYVYIPLSLHIIGWYKYFSEMILPQVHLRNVFFNQEMQHSVLAFFPAALHPRHFLLRYPQQGSPFGVDRLDVKQQ